MNIVFICSFCGILGIKARITGDLWSDPFKVIGKLPKSGTLWKSQMEYQEK
jgi:hypothetical protein